VHSSLREGQPAGAHSPTLPRPVPPGPGSASPNLSASLVSASLEYNVLGGDSDWEWKLLMMHPKTGDQGGMWTSKAASLLGEGEGGRLYGSNGGVSGQGLRRSNAVSRTELMPVEDIAQNFFIFPDEVNVTYDIHSSDSVKRVVTSTTLVLVGDWLPPGFNKEHMQTLRFNV